MGIKSYFKDLDNFYIREGNIVVNLNNNISLKKIISNSNRLEKNFIIEFPELLIKNYDSFNKIIYNYVNEYNTNSCFLSSLTLNNYMSLDNKKNHFLVEQILNETYMVKIDSLEILENLNNRKLNNVFIDNVSLQTFDFLENFDTKTNMVLNISNPDTLYTLIKNKVNMKIMLEFNVLNILSDEEGISFEQSAIEGFNNLEIIECIEILKQNNCLHLVKGINIDLSEIQKNIYNFKNAITQISKLVEYLHASYLIDIEMIYLKNFLLVKSSEGSFLEESISNILYIIHEILSSTKNQKILFDIDTIIFDNASVYVSSLEKRQVINYPIQEDKSKMYELTSKLYLHSTSNNSEELLGNIKNINQLYNLGYITLETLNMTELDIIKRLEKVYSKEVELLYFKKKYFINSILVDALKEIPIFGISNEEELELIEIIMFEKLNFHKFVKRKAYINNSEKQIIIQFLDANIGNALAINTYCYQSKNNALIKIDG